MKSGRHEDLLRYYKDELTYLRRMGGEFARVYPRVAERLELGRDFRNERNPGFIGGSLFEDADDDWHAVYLPPKTLNYCIRVVYLSKS